MVKYLRIREFRNYFHIPAILSADPIRDQEFGPLGTDSGYNRRPEVEESQPQGHGGGALKEGETVIGLGQGQTTPIPVPAYASAENSELAQRMSCLIFSEPEFQTTELDRQVPLQESKEEMVRLMEGPLGVLAHVRPLQTKGSGAHVDQEEDSAATPQQV